MNTFHCATDIKVYKNTRDIEIYERLETRKGKRGGDINYSWLHLYYLSVSNKRNCESKKNQKKKCPENALKTFRKINIMKMWSKREHKSCWTKNTSNSFVFLLKGKKSWWKAERQNKLIVSSMKSKHNSSVQLIHWHVSYYSVMITNCHCEFIFFNIQHSLSIVLWLLWYF